MHTAEDPQDKIKHTARELIDYASQKKFDVIAITNHNKLTYNKYLKNYAAKKNILLIPGIELTVEKKHVIYLNSEEFRDIKVKTISELKRYKNEKSAIIAPHPYFPTCYALNSKLEENINLFDAIEYTHFYFKKINFNKKAQEKAKEYNLPLVGVSDAHFIQQIGTTYSLVEAEKNPEAVIKAIKENKIEVVTQPLKVTPFNLFLSLKHLSSLIFPYRNGKLG